MDADDDVSGFIDFGDALKAPRIIEVATAAAYLRAGGENPLKFIEAFVKGYHQRSPLSETELNLLFDLIRTRLAMTLIILYWRLTARDEDDPYRQKTLDNESNAFEFLFSSRISATTVSIVASTRPVEIPCHQEATHQSFSGNVIRESGGHCKPDSANFAAKTGVTDRSHGVPHWQCLGSSITYLIAIGPQQGRKVFTLQTPPDCSDGPLASRTGNVAGFSLHAGVTARAHQRAKLERLCRYIARPAVSTQRLSLTRNGQVRYELKTPYRNGTTHVIFEPLDFISRGVALIPKTQNQPHSFPWGICHPIAAIGQW